MDRLEESLHWRPRRDLSLPQRIYHLAEGALALKEIEIMGQTGSGQLTERIRHLIEFLLGRVEGILDLSPAAKNVPERVKGARQEVIVRLEAMPDEDSRRNELVETLDDLFLVVQAFSYPGDYVSQQPSIERIAETLDKFEEDLLGVKTATIHGARQAIVAFGEPVIVPSAKKTQLSPRDLTRMLQDRVMELLHTHPAPARSG
jgi:hypothetical protein